MADSGEAILCDESDRQVLHQRIGAVESLLDGARLPSAPWSAATSSMRVEPDKAERLADIFSSGHWTHDYPISVEEARTLGLAVSEDLPEEVYLPMDLYPQAANQRASVSYIPMPYRREGEQTVGGDKPPTGRRSTAYGRTSLQRSTA